MSIVGQQLVEMSCERYRKKINNFLTTLKIEYVD